MRPKKATGLFGISLRGNGQDMGPPTSTDSAANPRKAEARKRDLGDLGRKKGSIPKAIYSSVIFWGGLGFTLSGHIFRSQ